MRIAVVDLATGAERAAVPLEPEVPVDIDLAADGRLAVSSIAGVTAAAPGVGPRLIPGSRGCRARDSRVAR